MPHEPIWHLISTWPSECCRHHLQRFQALELERIRSFALFLSMQESNLGTLLVIILLTQKPVSIINGQLKRIKATRSGRAARP
jgi:hypothetical protein